VELIIHAGGVLADATLQQQQLHGVQQVVGAKLSPVAALLRACGQQPVRSVVLFSSVASLLGSPGQSNYAAANAGLDAAARAAQVCGLPAVSLQWGAWSGGGMASADAQIAARVERLGMSMISPAAGLAALESALLLTGSKPLASPSTGTVSAIPFNWPTFLARQNKLNTGSFFSEFAATSAAATGKQSRSSRRRGVRAVPSRRTAASAEGLQQQVSSAVSSILGHSVDADEPLVAAGLDSLGSVELRNSLQSSLLVELPATLVSGRVREKSANVCEAELQQHSRHASGSDALGPV
jgi:hypothetical protein